MDEKKQIEEMAKTICDICRPKTDCANGQICTMAYLEAEGLYKEGFRKQSEGVWEEHVDFVHGSEFVCSFCKQGIQHYYGQNYCDVCGSKMREEFENLGSDM